MEINNSYNRIIIMYHKYCRDGHCAAAIAHWYFTEYYKGPASTIVYMSVIAGKSDQAVAELVEKYGAAQGTLIGPTTDTIVLAFDLTFTRNAAKNLFEHFPLSRVYDHHISTYENCLVEPLEIFNDRIIFNNSVCGAMLAFNEFFPERQPPSLVLYVQDRDLWKWEMPDSRDVNSGLYEMLSLEYYKSEDMPQSLLEHLRIVKIKFESMDEMMPDFTQWIDYMKNPNWLGDAKLRGSIVNDVTRKAIVRLAKNGAEHLIGEHKVCVCNAGLYQSELGEYLYLWENEQTPQQYKYDYVLMWRYDHNRECCYVSLRSRKGHVDVSGIAKKIEYNGRVGGGHCAAAGFEIDLPGLFQFIGKPL